MPRKKRIDAADPAASQPHHTDAEPSGTTLAPAEEGQGTAAAATIESPADSSGKHYGPPYKAVFTSAEKGFELGENRRFKQRVFTFKDRPAQEVIDRLKEHGFTYRAAEKAWTVEATAESRVLTDRLARELAGNDQSMSRG